MTEDELIYVSDEESKVIFKSSVDQQLAQHTLLSRQDDMNECQWVLFVVRNKKDHKECLCRIVPQFEPYEKSFEVMHECKEGQ